MLTPPPVCALPADARRRVRRTRRGWLVGLLTLLLLLLGWPAAPASTAPAPSVSSVPQLSRIPPGKGRVALTFDGDAFGGRISEILSTLARHHAHATFFLTATYLTQFPVRSRAIAAAGQQIASHGYEHRDYRGLSNAGINWRLAAWVATYHAVTGRYGPPLWRAPSGYSDNRVRQAATQAGFRTIYWTVDALDTVGPPKSATFVYNQLIHSGVTLDGAILLLHVNPNGTVDALPRVLAALEARGLDVVSVSGLLAP